MNPNDLLIWMVLVSCGMGLLGSLRTRQPGAGAWRLVFLTLIGVTLAGLAMAPERIGYLAGSLWLLIMVIPAVGYRQVPRLLLAHRFRDAARLASLLRWLHPDSAWQAERHLWTALALIQEGRRDDGLTALRQLRQGPAAIAHHAHCHYLRLENRWDELRTWFEETLDREQLFAQPVLVTYYLRALGEIGDLPQLIRFYRELQGIVLVDGMTGLRQQARLFLAAFLGRPDLTPRLFTGPLAGTSVVQQRFWLATAYHAAGATATADQLYANLHAEADPLITPAIERRRTWPLANPADVLTVHDRFLLDRIETDIDREAAAARQEELPRRDRLVKLLIGLNLAMFAAEVLLGGSQNPLTLTRLGALVTDQVATGEWWRIATAIFLHWGVIHIAVNMLGLWIFGPYVEAVLGTWRFLLVYFGAGLGSMLTVVAVNLVHQRPEMVVGASGCIMGLVGATAAIFWRAWRRHHDRTARQRLVVIAMIVAFQTVFDLATPQVSALAHASGVVFGLLIATALSHRHPAR